MVNGQWANLRNVFPVHHSPLTIHHLGLARELPDFHSSTTQEAVYSIIFVDNPCSFMKKGIMLVDDDPEDREEFSDVYLAQFPGEELYFAENGEKAIECLEQLFQKRAELCL